MAQIVPTDAAPDEKVHYSFSSASFDLAPGDSFDTDDSTLINDAKGHPWLAITFPEAPAEAAPVEPEAAVVEPVPAVDQGVQNTETVEPPADGSTNAATARRR